MSVDGFPSIMIPLEQQGCVNPSVQSIWPKKENFETAELHLLLEAICALTPSLQISNTEYNSPLNCHSPRHVQYINDSCGSPSNHARLMRDNSVTRQLDPFSLDLHSPSMETKQPQACGTGHSCEPSFAVLQYGSPKSKPISTFHGSITTANCNNLSNCAHLHTVDSNSSKSETVNKSKAQLPPKQASTYWPRKIRKKKTWLLKKKTSKYLDTIPENQEWKIQDAYQRNILANIPPENFEPKSVFENDSDSEDDVED